LVSDQQPVIHPGIAAVGFAAVAGDITKAKAMAGTILSMPLSPVASRQDAAKVGHRLGSPRRRARVEVRGFVGDPGNKPRNHRISVQGIGRLTGPGEFSVGEIRVDRPMADRVERHGQPSAAALGHGVVPFDPPAEFAAA
jgi:hypothetical protein